MNERVTRKLVVRGRVQGVWFRESMRREAQALGVTGWVRNRGDGSVEAVVQGTAASVESITAWARRGPAEARVEALEAEAADGDYARFEKRPSE